jgi:hypothetical protein
MRVFNPLDPPFLGDYEGTQRGFAPLRAPYPVMQGNRESVKRNVTWHQWITASGGTLLGYVPIHVGRLKTGFGFQPTSFR